jgi:hypothetical protein
MLRHALTQVFCRPTYLVIGALTSLVVFVFSVWLPNLQLIAEVLWSSAEFWQRLKFPISLLGSITTNYSLLSASYTVIMAILFGLNVSLAIFFLRRRLTSLKQTGVAVGLLGVISGIFGIGCAACGSFLAMTFLTWVGAGALIGVLPLKGGEFGILGIILLLISLYLTARQIENPVTCRLHE